MKSRTDVLFILLMVVALLLAMLVSATQQVGAAPLFQETETPTPTVTPIMPDLVLDSEIAYGDTVIVTLASCLGGLSLLAFLYWLIKSQTERG